MFPNFLTPIISKLALFWLDDLFLAHRMAAIVSLNSLRKISLLSDENDRRLLTSVMSSLEREILAVEAILGISPDD